MTAIARKTKETQIEIEIGATTSVETPLPMLTHLLETFARYAGLGLVVRARSLDQLDHHLIEDTALALGRALRAYVGDRPVHRYGQRLLPMDEVLVAVALDVGGRPYYAGPLPDPMYDHFLRSLAFEAGWTLHVELRRPGELHHTVEAAFKATGMALREALVPATQVASTKGKVRLRGR